MSIDQYVDIDQWKRMEDFSAQKETPFLVIDLKKIEENYKALVTNFPNSKVYYAVKANPAIEVIQLLHSLGSYFDIASRYELDRVLSLGIDPSRISYGNTIKKRKDIAYFYKKGVRLFVTDSDLDLANIAQNAPGSNVFVRILTEGDRTSEWPLSRKFGCQPDMAMDLIVMAKRLSLHPVGISFHVGSQQLDIGAWDAAIAKVYQIFNRLWDENQIKLNMINMGGGLPGRYMTKTHELETYAQEITRFLEEDFGPTQPEIILEPGRSLVADAGILVSEVVLISRKSVSALNRWVYTDVGKFHGLIETMGESIKFPLFTDTTLQDENHTEEEMEEVVLAGPTCDSADILYEDYKYPLPLDLAIGDRLYWCTTGAYTRSYSSIEFNGFPPLKAYCINEDGKEVELPKDENGNLKEGN